MGDVYVFEAINGNNYSWGSYHRGQGWSSGSDGMMAYNSRENVTLFGKA